MTGLLLKFATAKEDVREERKSKKALEEPKVDRLGTSRAGRDRVDELQVFG